MSAHKHTPGPWNVFKGGWGGFIYFGVSGIAHMTPAYVEAQSAPAETMQANAYLIAAAPELLAAAKKAYDFLKSEAPIPESQFKVLCDLAVAIERAGGEA